MNEYTIAPHRPPAGISKAALRDRPRKSPDEPGEPIVALHVAGRAVRTDATLPVDDPYSGRTLAHVSRAGAEELEAALGAARRYADAPLAEAERAATLHAWADAIDADADALARLLTAENGKPIVDARIEVRRAAMTARRYADAALELNAEARGCVERLLAGEPVAPNAEGIVAPVFHRPLGVVAAFTPFNFPANTVVHKIAAAVAAGNACLLKPSEKTPLVALELARLFAPCVPAGTPSPLSVLSGHWADFLGPFLDDPRVDFFTMTGHTDVGRRLARRFAAAHPFGRSHFELGGNAAQICLDDVAPEAAAALVTAAVFEHNGSRCTTPRKVLVPAGAWADAFAAAAVALALDCRTGDPADSATRIGPLIDDAAAAAVEGRVREALDAGARLLAGGTRTGRTIDATVLDGVRPDMRIFTEENFGPVLCLMRYESIDEAVRIANLGSYGLQPAVLTHDLRAGHAVGERLRGGCINVGHATTASRSDLVPFGGVGDSGCGKEGGVAGVRELCVEVPIKFHAPPT